jgi:hypothetical protein
VSGQVKEGNFEVFTWSWESLAWRADDFSFWDFFYQIGITEHEGLKKYLDYLHSGVFFSIFLTDFAIVCRRPKAIRRDTNNLLDSDQLPAIEWRDGYKLWSLHGVAFKEDVWKKVVSQELTLPELAKLELGADQRAVAIQMLRPDRLLEQLGAKKIATGLKYTKLQDMYGEDYCAANFPWSLNTPTELYEVKNFMDTGETEYCMKMEHPSIKGKFYIEWCPPEIGRRGDADYAQASAFGMDIEEYFNATEA